MTRRGLWLRCGWLLCAAGAASITIAQNDGRRDAARSKAQREAGSPASSNGRQATPKEQPMALTPAREAAALTFARLHHPELAELLGRLKRHNQAAYRRAIRQLYQDSERLARIKDREKDKSSQRYQLALDMWKLDSRIRLLAARVATAKRPNSKLEAQLKEALLERIDLRIRQIELDRERLLQRIQRLDESISTLRNDRDKAANQYLLRVKRSLGIKKRRPAANTGNKRRTAKKQSAPRKDAGRKPPQT